MLLFVAYSKAGTMGLVCGELSGKWNGDRNYCCIDKEIIPCQGSYFAFFTHTLRFHYN